MGEKLQCPFNKQLENTSQPYSNLANRIEQFKALQMFTYVEI